MDDKILAKILEKCRHSMRGMKGFTACCIYCNKSLDEIIVEAYGVGKSNP